MDRSTLARVRASALQVLFTLLALCGSATGMAPDAAKDFEKAAKSNNVPGMVAALEAMKDGPPTKDHVETILQIVPQLKNKEAYIAGRDALSATTGPAREELVKGLKGKRVEQRVLVCDGLSGCADDAAATALGTALDDKELVVRVSAIRGLARVARRASVGPLVERVGKVDIASGGAEVDELYRALLTLTGQALETAADWKKWWEVQPPDFDPKKVAQPGDAATTRTRAPSAGKIFESEVRSNAFVLVLDVSSSMRVIDLPEGQTWKDAAGKDHDFKDPGMGAPHDDSRFMRAKREFCQFIQALTPKTKIAIIVYGDKAKAWKEELVPANDANKKQAVDFVMGVQWEPATVTDVALEKAFSIPGADTIYLFSDGIPERRQNGKNVDIPQDEVIAKAQQLNLTAKKRLHCYGFAGASSTVRDFLRRLAVANDGEYKDIR